ncbi:hypothetical protein MJ904_15545 [Massilia sp. MB5]|uniref:hypothetical protein n=1 Tax=Massilia sp. MB5 TaxID=2919578 RepID=UPI001F0E114F|nr:hypothetical protein [Massilia sp. MB5]UMR28559.1 hypothetical protein MJ904_15545 [Massilia sp. MB5]
MAIQANASGVATGSFVIPGNIPAGTKRVDFFGSGGSRGSAVYLGQGTRITELRQMITQVVYVHTDPLAQTFSLPESTQLAGVRLWFTAKGPSQVVVQLRGVVAGVPNNVVHAEGRILPAAIGTTGPTQIAFDAPVWIDANTEYALVIQSNDATTKLAVAEMNMWDVNAGRRVLAQPYQVGVLLSSSNASTWTAHQDRDLTFELLKAVFSETSRNVELGSVAVSNATDLLLLSLAEAPTFNSRVEYTLSLPSGASVNVAEGQPLRLAKAETGNVGVTAKLSGTAAATPVLYPGTQLISGAVKTTADYVSVAFPAGNNSRIRVVLDATLPSGAGIVVKVAGADPTDIYADMPQISSRQLGLNKYELTYEITAFSKSSVKVKLVLSGLSSARPEVENLRAMAM